MNAITATEVSRLRAAIESVMFDICLLGTTTEDTTGTYVTETVTWGTTDIPCGFTPATQSQTYESGEAQANFSEATLRLPLSVSITGFDRVRLTSRFGRPLSPAQEFRIEGAPQAGAGCWILTLVAVTPGGRG